MVLNVLQRSSTQSIVGPLSGDKSGVVCTMQMPFVLQRDFCTDFAFKHSPQLQLIRE